MRGAGRDTYWRDNTFSEAVSGTLYGDRSEQDARPDVPAVGLVYFLRAPGHAVKIGFTTNLSERVRTIQHSCPCRLILVGCLHGDLDLERLMKQRFAEHRLHGEWFDERILPDVLDLVAADSEFYPS